MSNDIAKLINLKHGIIQNYKLFRVQKTTDCLIIPKIYTFIYNNLYSTS